MLKALAAKKIGRVVNKTLGLLIVIGVFCVIFILAHRALFDSDIWLHLKAGEVIVQTGAIPSCDIFSFTMQGKPWIDHEWLFQIIVYLVYNLWQADGLVNLEAYILVISFLVLFFIGHKNLKSYALTAVFMLLAAYASVSRFNIRPDIFSLLFFSIFLYLLRFKLNKKTVWLLIPVQILWVNIHGYFFLGLLLVSLFILAGFLCRRVKFLRRYCRGESLSNNADYARLKKILFILLLSCLVNPQFLKGALYPVYVIRDTLMGENQVFFKNIQELRPTFNAGSFNLSRIVNFIYILPVSLLALNTRKAKLIDILLFLAFFILAWTARNIAYFAFIAYVIITLYFIPAKEMFFNCFKPIPAALSRLLRVFSSYIAPLIFLVFLIFKINHQISGPYYDFNRKEFISGLFGVNANSYPGQAADFILKNAIKANMLNNFNAGAYLIGRGYPAIKVFIDGRTELYGQDFFKRLSDLCDGDSVVFETSVNKYNIGAIFFTVSYNSVPEILAYIYQRPEWKLVFFDGRAVIFLKDLPGCRDIINAHKIDFRDYSPPKIDWPNLAVKNIFPSPYLTRAALLYAFNEDEAAISECREALRIMPDNAKAYHIMGKVYLRRKSYAQARENLHAAYVLSPRTPAIMVDLGIALKYFGETKKALNLFIKALKLFPDYARAHYQLAALYLDDADGLYGAAAALDKAGRELDKASALNSVLSGQDKEQALEITEKIRQGKR